MREALRGRKTRGELEPPRPGARALPLARRAESSGLCDVDEVLNAR